MNINARILNRIFSKLNSTIAKMKTTKEPCG